MDFDQNIRATLLYFDLFEHPLNQEELYKFFPEKMEADDFDEKLSRSRVRSIDGLYHIRDDDGVVAIRKRRERKARGMLRAATLVGSILRYAPFVRAVFLSGSLSKGVNAGDADVDLMIVSAEERLWVCRSILTVLKKVFLFNRKKFLCPNYFVTENHLSIPEKNIFTATELVTLRPLFNEKKLSDLLLENSWISNFYPNFQYSQPSRPKEQGSPLQKLLELPMSDGYTARWDTKLMHYFESVWEKRYPEFDLSERELLFRTTPYSSKIHPNDFQTRVLDTYEERLKRENLERLTRYYD